MRVCHITTVHSSRDNRIFYKECTFLAEQGYEVILLAPAQKEYQENKVRVLPFVERKGRLKRALLNSFWGVLQKSFRVKADLYHFHDPEIIPAALILRLFGKKVIYDAHENLAAAIRSKPYIPSLLRGSLSWIIRLLEHFASFFFSGIVTARPDITETFAGRICTLRNFPKLADLKGCEFVEIKKEKFAVIYVGGMAQIRGIRELVDAFADLSEAELWLLGRFTESDLEDYCRNSKGWRNTRFFGQVAPYEIFSYIKRADVGIVTFYPEPNHVRTLATKPFEYMACGLPMIMSDFAYWREFFGEGSVYVDPLRAQGIADAVKMLMNDPQMRENSGKKNYSLIMNEYNWDKEFGKLIEYYREIVG